MLTHVLAILAACANAVSSVLQRKANLGLPAEDSLSLRLIQALFGRPVWYLGVLGVTAGFLLQAAALSVGELSVVEPILVFELPLTLILASWVFRAPLHRREWSSVAGMTVGLAVMLFCLAPSGGNAQSVDWVVWLVGVGVNVAVVAAAVLWGRTGKVAERPELGGRRAVCFGVAAGCQFGLTAALMKGAVAQGGRGVAAVCTSWQLYAMVVSGIAGMFFLQSAMHAGRLLAAQPGLTLSDPLVSVLWGVVAFHEEVRQGWWLLPAIAGAAAITICVAVLARSPLLGDEERLPPRARRSAVRR